MCVSACILARERAGKYVHALANNKGQKYFVKLYYSIKRERN